MKGFRPDNWNVPKVGIPFNVNFAKVPIPSVDLGMFSSRSGHPMEKRVFDSISRDDRSALLALIQETPMEERIELVNMLDKDGGGPLYAAASTNKPKCARLLLDNGADVHTHKGEKGTPLHAAANRGHLLLVELLLSTGASPFVCNKLGKTALDLALKKGEDKIIELFLQRFIFCGFVSVECEGIGGWVRSYKRVKVMVLPNFAYPAIVDGKAEHAGVKPSMSKVLWIFSGIYHCRPRTQLCLDGASLSRENGERAVLHLDASHPEPTGVYKKQNNGRWDVYFGPASYDMDYSFAQPNASALDKYHLFLSHCDGTFVTIPTQQRPATLPPIVLPPTEHIHAVKYTPPRVHCLGDGVERGAVMRTKADELESSGSIGKGEQLSVPLVSSFADSSTADVDELQSPRQAASMEESQSRERGMTPSRMGRLSGGVKDMWHGMVGDSSNKYKMKDS